jgi:hypothetical protein
MGMAPLRFILHDGFQNSGILHDSPSSVPTGNGGDAITG